MDGFSGMVSFEVKGGLTAAQRVLSRLRIFKIAESLGGVESLVELPAVMTHASIPKNERKKAGLRMGSFDCRSALKTSRILSTI